MSYKEISYIACDEVCYKDLEFINSEITIRTMISREDLELAKKIINKDDVIFLLHYRDSHKIEYKTKLTLKDNTRVFIDGGLTTGYVGGGPSAFAGLLKHLGIEETEAEYIAERKNSGIERAKIEIEF